MNTSREIITIQGYVEALPKHSRRDDSARVAVVTAGGDAYHVIHKGAGVDLVDHVSSAVEVTGTAVPVKTPGDARQAEQEDPAEPKVFSMQIRSYLLRDDFDDSWYDNSP